MKPPTPLRLGSHPDFPTSGICYDLSLEFGWAHPSPSIEELESYYRCNYRSDRPPTPDSRYQSLMRRRADAQRRFIVRSGAYGQFEAMLDLGCGGGFLLHAFASQTKVRIGFETDEKLAPWAADYVGPDATIHCRHFVPHSRPERQFSLIAMSHMLEHVADPVAFLRDLHSWLAPGGYVFIEVPHDPLSSVLWQVRHRFLGLAHLCFFTPRSLATAARNAGFDVVRVNAFGLSVHEFWREKDPKRDTNLLRLRRAMRAIHDRLPQTLAGSSPLRTIRPSHGIHLRMLLVRSGR